MSLPTFLSRDSRNPCIFVLVLVLSPQGGTRTRLASYIEYEYEYHFIEYEYDGSPKVVGKDKDWFPDSCLGASSDKAVAPASRLKTYVIIISISMSDVVEHSEPQTLAAFTTDGHILSGVHPCQHRSVEGALSVALR